MEVRVFEPPTQSGGAFEILGVTERCDTVSVTSNFYTPGTFSLSIPWWETYADTLAAGRLVTVDKTFVGQIDTVTQVADGEGRRVLASGVDIPGLAARALCVPPGFVSQTGSVGLRTLTGRTETLIKTLWRENLVQPPQSWRGPVHGLVLASDLGRGLAGDVYSVPPDIPVSEVTRLLGERAGLGVVYTADLENGRIVVDVSAGADHTGHQSALDPVVFSFDRRTLRSLTREVGDRTHANVFLAASYSADFEAGAHMAATPTAVGGWRRREQYLSVDVEDPGDTAALRAQTDAERVAYGETDNITIDIDPGRYLYGADFALGDLCTIQDREFDLETDLRIVSVTMTAGPEGVTYTIGAGMKKTTAFGVLRRMILNGR